MTFTETSETPASPAPAPMERLPPAAQERVTVGPPADWVTVRPLDEASDAGIPGSQIVLLLDRQYRVLGNERYERLARCVKTVQAAHEAEQWRLDFEPASQSVVVHSVAVRRAGQVIEQVELGRLRFRQGGEERDRPVAEGSASVGLRIEDVRVGDIIDVSFTIRTAPRLMAGNFWLWSTVPAQVHLHAFSLSVRYPDARALRWKHSDDSFTPVFKKHQDESEWQWSLAEIRPREIEPGLPGWHAVNPWMQVSDCASWSEVAGGIGAAWGENFDEAELREAAARIASACGASLERAGAALTFVQDEIRQLPLHDPLSAQFPASPGTVLRRRVGDCRDKTFLAMHLLRRLGLPARVVLVHSDWHQTVERLLPMPDAFDHALVEYEVAGKRRWADVAERMQGGSAVSRAIRDFRLGLPLGPGVADLQRIASATSLGDVQELRETFMLDTAGRPSALKVVVKAAGAEADLLRREFALEGEEAVARKREQFYRQFFPDLRRVAVLEWRDDRPRNEFILAEMYEMRTATVPGREAQTCVFEYRAHLIQGVLGFSDTGPRKQPFAVRYPCQIHHWIEVESPALEGAPQQTTAGRDAAFRFSCDFTRQYGKIVVHYSLRTLSDGVKAERFEQFKTKIREIWPTTFLHVALPLGVIMSRRNRAAGNLLPVLATPSQRNKNGAATGELPPEKPALPSVPAPALSSDATLPAEPPGEAAPDSPPESENAPLERRTDATRAAAAVGDPASSPSRSRDQRKRRRSKSRSPWKKSLRIGLYVIVGLVVLYFLIVANLQKG